MASVVKCPHCKADIQVQVNLTPTANRPNLPGWNRRPPSQNFQTVSSSSVPQAAAPTLDPFDEYYRQSPARAADFMADVIVPGAQAVGSGIAAILPSIAVVNLLNWAAAGSGVAVAIHWTASLWASGIVTSWVWYHSIKDHNAGLWQTEEGKRRTAAPPPAPAPIKTPPPVIPVEIINRRPATEDEPHVRRLDIPGIEMAELQILADGIKKGIPLTEVDWTPQKDGKPFGSRRYRQIINTLDALGFTELINPAAPQQGRRLTYLGESVFNRVAAGNTPFPAGK